MKITTILSSILFLSTNLAIGQTFAPIGAEWYYSENAGGACPGNCEYVHLSSVSDTLIQGNLTHKLTQTYYRHNGDTSYLEPMYLFQTSDTVFMWSSDQSKFLKTFIFNANIGDTLVLDSPDDFASDSTYRLVIDTIILEQIDGIAVKKYKTIGLDDYHFWNGGYFMDKIGGLDWFLPRATIIPEAGGPIRCYADMQVDTSFQSVACDYILYTSVDEVVDKDLIQVYPNPTAEMVIVDTELPIDRIELYDYNGQLITTTTNQTFDVSNLSNGQYILIFHLNNGQMVEKNIIKVVR